MKRTVTYAYSRQGYEVVVMDACGNIVEAYSAGNHRLDSQQHTDDSQWRLPLRTLRRYARQTALEMAKEHNISQDNVHLDADRMHETGNETSTAPKTVPEPIRQVRVVQFTLRTHQPGAFGQGLFALCEKHAVPTRQGTGFGYTIKIR